MCYCAYFWFVCFSHTSANSDKDLETLTRTTFPLSIRDDGLPNVAVAHDFWRNSYCRARILQRQPIKHLLNSDNCIKYLAILTCYTILLWHLISRIPTSIAFNNENTTFLLRALAGSPNFVRARTGSHGVSRTLRVSSSQPSASYHKQPASSQQSAATSRKKGAGGRGRSP